MKKQYKNDSGIGIDVSQKVVQAIPTGSLQLDYMTGVGGIPRGYITEFWGNAGVGKSSLAFLLASNAQKLGHRVAYFDVEHGLVPDWLMKNGVDTSPDKLFFSQPEIGEDALDIMADCIASGYFGMVILDSIAALTPRKDLTLGSVEDKTIGTTASLVRRGIMRMRASVNTTQTALVFVNQMRHKIGTAYGDPRYRPGGDALEFAASLIMLVSKEKVEVGKEEIGFQLRVQLTKTRFSTLIKEPVPEILVHSTGGIDVETDTVQAALDSDVIQQRGPWYNWGEMKFQGKNNIVKFLQENPDVHTKLRLGIYDYYIKGNNVKPEPPTLTTN